MRVVVFEFPVALDSVDEYYGEEYFDTEQYEYEVSTKKVNKVLAELFSDKYDIKTEVAEKIANDFDLWDLLEQDFEDELDDYIREMYYKDAREEFDEWRK